MIDPPALEFEARSWRDGGRAFVRFDGELDFANEGLARVEVEIALKRGAGELVLDLGGLEFLDARGVHVLLDAHSACRAQRRHLRLIPPPERVRHTLALCGVSECFEYLGGRSSANDQCGAAVHRSPGT